MLEISVISLGTAYLRYHNNLCLFQDIEPEEVSPSSNGKQLLIIIINSTLFIDENLVYASYNTCVR